MLSDRSIIGICGGVGPAAGLLLHQAILTNTESGGSDQGHLNVCHVSRSGDAPDRTEYLLGKSDQNPAAGLARTVGAIKAACVARHCSRAVIGVPCNTFHAPAIWDQFQRECRERGYVDEGTTVLHMLDETLQLIREMLPNCDKVGLLSTTGTRTSRVYHDLFEPQGFTIVQVADDVQSEVHDAIYNKQYGIKATTPAVSDIAIQRFHSFASMLEKQGAQAIILGCTEIPFAFQGVTKVGGAVLIDPMTALARALINVADPQKLKPLTDCWDDVKQT